jgi:hypothetical protein
MEFLVSKKSVGDCAAPLSQMPLARRDHSEF